MTRKDLTIDRQAIGAMQSERIGGRAAQHDGILGKQWCDIGAQFGQQLRLHGRGTKGIQRQHLQRRAAHPESQLQLEHRAGDADGWLVCQRHEHGLIEAGLRTAYHDVG
jgi:hypothetical protein